MKKIILALVLVCITVLSFAQLAGDSATHLTFKGVAIDGTLSAYVLNMKLVGFDKRSAENGTAKLEGEFAGYKGCLLEVSTLKQKDLVSKVAVMFPVVDTWPAIWENYSSVKELLKEKYGQPANEVEKFETPFEPADSDKMHYVESGRITYRTRFERVNGSIEISISTSKAGGFVQLTYYDKINSAVMKANALSDL